MPPKMFANHGLRLPKAAQSLTSGDVFLVVLNQNPFTPDRSQVPPLGKAAREIKASPQAKFWFQSTQLADRIDSKKGGL